MKTKETKKEKSMLAQMKENIENANVANVETIESAQSEKVYTLVENDVNEVKKAAKTINDENKEFRRQLDVNLLILREQYAALEETRKSFDFLARVTSTPVENFFNADFVRKLYKVYTYNVLDANGVPCGVYTCISETHKKTDKTDFAKLAARALANVGENLDISASETDGLYYTPVYNFTAANILRYLQKIDSYVVSLANYRAKKAAEYRKAKKADKKAAKKAAKENAAQAAPVETEETKAA